jgi:N-acetylglucosaminyl-diphospho-decaprenol L-rhamnosyltransferase
MPRDGDDTPDSVGPQVDVVVVAYNSNATLRACVAPLAADPSIHVTVVDNRSPDDPAHALDGQPVTLIRADRNGGFGSGCNLGARGGRAAWILFVNPDAVIGVAALQQLVAMGESDTTIGLVGPRIVDPDGTLDWTRRRFGRLRSSYAQAFYLHRVLPRATWTDEVERDPDVYEHDGPAEWLSGACMLVRRSAFEAVGGFDEGFFMYCEDMDLCRRLRYDGYEIRFAAHAVARHVGGTSAPRAQLRPVLAASRVRYARKHDGRARAALAQIAVALYEVTHALGALGRPSIRAGHVAALGHVLRMPSQLGSES